ncbi:hypothetical protein IW148_004099 [Coemansia sp. RSA 1199]|nr:hypothetical protein IW148_004099 [Coemansia sp. RSA 1199]
MNRCSHRIYLTLVIHQFVNDDRQSGLERQEAAVLETQELVPHKLPGQVQELQELLERVSQEQVQEVQVPQEQVRLLEAEQQLVLPVLLALLVLLVLLEFPEQAPQELQARLLMAEVEQLLVLLAHQEQKLEDQLAQEAAVALSTVREFQAPGPLAMAVARLRNCHFRAESGLEVVEEQ